MRERSKNAARSRREKENHEFSELARLLPHPSSSTANMDKATVVKLTTAYLKLRNIFPYGLGAPWGSETQDKFLSDHAAFLVKSLEGFLIIIGHNSKVTYVSEGVSFYLGLSQTEMMGNSIQEYVHMCDHEELKILLNQEELVPVGDLIHQEMEVARSFSLRMKCVLTKRSAGLVIDKYKVIHFRGYLKLKPVSLPVQGTVSTSEVRYRAVGIVAVGNAIHPTTSLEVKMYNNTFMYRAGLDLKFLHVESRVKELTGYDPQQLLQKSLYKFVHPCDSLKLSEDHKKLLEKGQAVSSYYRLLTHSGGWIWIQSSFVLLLNSKSRQTFILAINHALSEREYKEYVFDEEQMKTKSGEFKWDEHGRLVAVKRSAVAPEISRKEVPKVKKKSSPISPITMNNYFDQFAASSSYVQPLNEEMTFINGFQPISRIQPANATVPSTSDVQQITCVQPANTSVTFMNDLQSIARNRSSDHAPSSHNNLRGCWYSGENMKNSYPSTTVLHHLDTQTPVNATHNSTEFCNSFPAASASSAYFGSESDPRCCSSMYLDPHSNSLILHAEGSTGHSKTSYPTVVEANFSRIDNNDEQLPYYLEPIYPNPIINSDATSSPDNSERSEASCTSMNNNGNSYSCEQPYCLELLSQNSSNYAQKYDEQVHNSHVASSADNAGGSETGININKSYPHLVLSLSDSFPENSEKNWEHTPNFDLPRINEKTEMSFANGANGDQLQKSQRDSVNQCSNTTDNAKDQIENMHVANSCCNEKTNSSETTAQSLSASLEITKYWPFLIHFNNASYNLELEDRGENALSIIQSTPQSHPSELSPVSAKSSLSSDQNNEHVNSSLNSSDYSNGYWEEINKGHSEFNCDTLSSSNTDYRKDLLGFPSFQSHASNTPLYTAL